ncbi:MAG: polyprenyl synthetase family protein, partial [Clostridia bacterium]|nr:polyprenyl synthetase family protein [Clostridia bacterium]
MTIPEIEKVLAEAISTPDPCLQELLNHVLKGGKGMRPSLVFTCAQFGRHDALEVQRTAVAIELVHLASLIHDDIMDGAETRRNRPALHCLYGNLPAVLAGDYLFATAFSLLTKGKKAILYTVTEAIRSMCSGEILQLSASAPDINAYYTYIGQKTAALFSAACRCGSILGHLKRQQQDCLARFGWHLGLTYQIIDDFLDLFGCAEKMNKPCRQDLRRGLYTLPVIRFLQLSPDAPQWQKNIERGLQVDEIEKLSILARKLGCDRYTV